jgi:transposase
VLVAEFCDYPPLYRQSKNYGREGVALERSTLANWGGQASALMRPLMAALEHQVLAAKRLHSDATPVLVLAPATGKNSTGQLWRVTATSGLTLARRHRWRAIGPPPDCRGGHPRAELVGFRGVL